MNKVINFQSKEQNSLPIAGFLEVSYTSHTHTRHEKRGEREERREEGERRERNVLGNTKLSLKQSPLWEQVASRDQV